VEGARVVRTSVLEGFPDTDISVSIVWIDMLPDDSKAAATRSAQTIDDPRARHFHDPKQRSGKAIAESLGCEAEVAWDIYLFYASGSEWVDGPPAPTDWMHQLPSAWADPAHFRTGDDLVNELRAAMQRLTAARG
jgi:hypothetical protein